MGSHKKILITGASGLVGRAAAKELIKLGHKVVALGRKPEADFRKDFSFPCSYYQWADPESTQPPAEALEGIDVVLNLMGESVAAKRWSEDQKTKLRTSRILTTRNLIKALNEHRPGLESFVSASAIGYYGDRGEAWLVEESDPAKDFLAQICVDWEKEVSQAPGRKILLRIGMVLSIQGGALEKMLPVFENGLGGRLSSGRQWMSWIHIDDLVQIIVHSISDSTLSGPVNAVSPHPVTNSVFTQHLAKALKVNAPFVVPKLALDVGMGEMSRVILGSQKVLPTRLTSRGFQFRFSKLEDALGDLFSWKSHSNDRLFLAEQWVPLKRSEIFPFFSDEKNLETLTPEFLNFHVVSKTTPQIQLGTEITYDLKIYKVPKRWVSRITTWKPGEQFTDEQLKGPYSKWVHLHTFEDFAGGTLMRDKVIYGLPLAKLGGNLAAPFVRKSVQEIFEFRKTIINQIFNNKGKQL